MARIASSSHPSWSEARFLRELALPQTRSQVAENRGAVVGFAIGWEVMDELELHLIAVDPSCRRIGVGTALLAVFGEQAAVTHLEVSEHNEAALALYRALGYAEVGKRPDYYGPGEAALLFRRIRR